MKRKNNKAEDFVFKLNGYHTETPSRLPTFHGVLEKHFDWICERYGWNAPSTLTGYSNDYNNFLLRHISDEIPFEELNAEYFTDTLRQMQSEYGHSPGRVNDFFRLIRCVVAAATANGVVWEDAFVGTAFSPTCSLGEKEYLDKNTLLLKKSFSPAEEILLVSQILEDSVAIMPGQNIAILLILELGFRPGEAANVKFGHIIPVPDRPGKYCIRMISSMEAGSTVEQAGGKTINATRTRPISNELYKILQERKDFVQSMVAPEIDISKLHIACYNHEYLKPCSAQDISVAAKTQFMLMKGNASTLEDLEVMLFQNRFQYAGIQEKDSSTYAMRRNDLTHHKNWGVSLTHSQFSAGHAFSDPRVKRSDFTNDDMLAQLADKTENMPIPQIIKWFRTGVKPSVHQYQQVIKPNSAPVVIKNEENCVLSIDSSDSEQELILIIETREPDDPIVFSIETNGQNTLDGEIEQWQSEATYDDEVNCRAQINRIYRKEINNISKKIIPLNKRNKKKSHS